MKTFTLLVKIQYFADKVKRNSDALSAYVIDYADYSTFALEQQGIYRYRKVNTCVLGNETPNEFLSLLTARDNRNSFYCNEKALKIKTKEAKRASYQPEDYAIVIYDCFQ